MPESGTLAERPSGGVHREAHGPQADVARRLSHSAPKRSDAGGEGVISPEPNIEETATGEVSESLPGSQSVAQAVAFRANQWRWECDVSVLWRVGGSGFTGAF